MFLTFVDETQHTERNLLEVLPGRGDINLKSKINL